MTSPQAHPLDNPVWSALRSRQSHLGLGSDLAVRLQPEVGPFAAVGQHSPQAQEALSALISEGEQVLFLALKPLQELQGLSARRLVGILQMVDRGLVQEPVLQGLPSVNAAKFERLGAADRDDMLALTQRTQPGPFGARTHETGHYIGLRDAGRLVAMAGERMRLPGFVEISAVCVDDTHRGQGIASQLMKLLRQQIWAQGDTPFLHVRDDNPMAIALYERLGFSTRQRFHLYALTRVAAGAAARNT